MSSPYKFTPPVDFTRNGATNVDKCVTVQQFQDAARKGMVRVNASITVFCAKTNEWQRKATALQKRLDGLTGDQQTQHSSAMKFQIARGEAEIQRRRSVCQAISRAHGELALAYKRVCALPEKTEAQKLTKMRQYTSFLIDMERIVLEPSGMPRGKTAGVGQMLSLQKAMVRNSTKEGLASVRDSLSGEFDFMRGERADDDLQMPRSVYDKIPETWPDNKLPSAFNCYDTTSLFRELCSEAYEKIRDVRQTADLSDLHNTLGCLTLKEASLFWSAGILVHHVIDTIMENSIRLTYATGEKAKRGFTVSSRARFPREIEKVLRDRLYCILKEREEVAGTGDKAKTKFRLHKCIARKLNTPKYLADLIKARRAGAKVPSCRSGSTAGFKGFERDPECATEKPEECEPKKPRHVKIASGEEGYVSKNRKHRSTVPVTEDDEYIQFGAPN